MQTIDGTFKCPGYAARCGTLLGLGTVIIGLFDHDRAKKVIHTPEGFELVTLIPVGYPPKVGNAPKRRGMDEFSHTERV